MNDRHSHEEFVERWKKDFVDYNRPPETPRDRMWARIQDARAARETIVEPVRPTWWRAWSRRLAVSVAAVAVLIIAFAVGRLSVPERKGDATVAYEENDMSVPPNEKATKDIYRLAAAPVLHRAELLLTQFRTTDKLNGDRESFAERASALLVDTRYLMNTPAVDDPMLRQLLGDLELVLAQIIRLAARNGHEKEWVDESIKGRLLVPRLRTECDKGQTI